MGIIADEWDDLAKSYGISLPAMPKTSTPIQSILDRVRQGVSEQESGGNTKAVNSRTNALGQFQVLPANVPSWTKKHLGRSLTPEEFKNNPDAQVQVFNGEFGSYLDKALKDSPDEDTAIRKAAAAWYGGEGAMHRYDDPTKFRLNEPSFREYTSSVLNRTKKSTKPDIDFDALSSKYLSNPVDFDNLAQSYGLSMPSGQLDTTPVPEAPETLQAQEVSAISPTSPRIGVVYAQGQTPTSDVTGSQLFPLKDGRAVLVNLAKAKKKGLKDAKHIQTYIDTQPDKAIALFTAIPESADVGTNTAGGMAVQTRVNGVPAIDTIAPTPESVPDIVRSHQAQFPNGEQQIIPTQQVADERNAELERQGVAERYIDVNAPDEAQYPPQRPIEDMLSQPIQSRGGNRPAKPRRVTNAPALKPVDEEQFNALNLYLTGQGQQPLTKEQFQAAVGASKVGKTSIGLDPNKFAVNGESVTRLKAAEEQAYAPYQEINANDAKAVGRAEVGEPISIEGIKTKEAAEAYVRKQLQARYPDGDFTNLTLPAWHPKVKRVVSTFDDLQSYGVNIKPLIREKVVQNRVENPNVDLSLNRPRLPEKEAEAKLTENIKDPINAAQQIGGQKLSGILSNPLTYVAPWLTIPYEAYKDATNPTVLDDKYVASEKERLLKQYGSLGRAWQAEEDYRNSDILEKGIRLANQTGRSFLKNLVSGTGKGIVFAGQLLEDLQPLNHVLPEEYRVGIRNTANSLDLLMRLFTSPNADTALAEWKKNRANGDNISDQQIFKAMQSFDDAVGDDPMLKGRLLGQIGDASGSAASFMALGLLTPELSLATKLGEFGAVPALWGALSQAGTGYEEGKQAGFDENTARNYGMIQGVLGMTEGFGIGGQAGKLIKNPIMRGKLAEGILEVAKKGVLKEGGEEFLQEMFQTVNGKIALEYLKDKEPDTYTKITNLFKRLPSQVAQTVTNEGLIAALTGGITGGAGRTAQVASQGTERENETRIEKSAKETPLIEGSVTKNADNFTPKLTEEDIATQPETKKVTPARTDRADELVEEAPKKVVAEKPKLSALDNIRQPSQTALQNAASGTFSGGTRNTNEIVPIDKLEGGTSNQAAEIQRINQLAKELQRPDAHFERIIIDGDNNVIEGQHRLEALRKLGVTNVPVVRISEIKQAIPNIAEIEKQFEKAVNLHREHRQQLIDNAAEIIAEEGVKGLRDYDAPEGYEEPWNKLVNIIDPKAPPRTDRRQTEGTKEHRIVGGGELTREGQERRIAEKQRDTDPVTGVASRFALDRALPTAEKDANTSVISFDANNFGQINKLMGEAEGDKAIKDIGDALHKAAEENGIGGRVFRKGGDEFVVLAPKDVAEKVRKAAEKHFGDKQYGETTVSLTGTVGDTFNEANAKLQEAKAVRKASQAPPQETRGKEPLQETASMTALGEKSLADLGLANKPWREVVDSPQLKGDDNKMRRHAILREIANIGTDAERADVLDRLKGEKYGEASNITWDIAKNPKASDAIRQRAQEMHDAISPPITPEQRIEMDRERWQKSLEATQQENEQLQKQKGKGAKQQIINNKRYIAELEKKLAGTKPNPLTLAKNKRDAVRAEKVKAVKEAKVAPTLTGQQLVKEQAKLAKRIAKIDEQIINLNPRNPLVPKLKAELADLEARQKELGKNAVTPEAKADQKATTESAGVIAVPRSAGKSKFGDTVQAVAYAKSKFGKESIEQIKTDVARAFKLKPSAVNKIIEEMYPIDERYDDAKALAMQAMGRNVKLTPTQTKDIAAKTLLSLKQVINAATEVQDLRPDFINNERPVAGKKLIQDYERRQAERKGIPYGGDSISGEAFEDELSQNEKAELQRAYNARSLQTGRDTPFRQAAETRQTDTFEALRNDREQPLFKAADAEAKDLIDRLATAHTEDVVDNTSIKIHDDGTGEISEGAQELIRRTLGTLTKKGLIKDSGQSFYGVTMSKNHLSLASRELKTYAVKLEKLGYKPEQVQSVKDLSDALKTLADKSDYNSLWVFEESKAHETVHREEKNAGGIDDIAEKRLSKSPFLKSKKFQKVNGHLSVKDQISEVAASLINNEDMGWDVPDFETHKKAFLNTWSDGIFRQAGLDTKNTSAENQKLLDEFIAKYPTIGKTYEDTKADTTGNETSESESVSPTESSGKGADNAETQGSGERVGVGEAAYTPSGKEKLSKTPKTLRKHGIDVADKPYIAATNAGQQEFATNLLDKGISKAHEWFNLQIEHGNDNNGGTTAVGLNLMKSYGMNGNLKAMNEVADELVPYLKESGQAIQAMAILNIFDPANASTYAAKYVKQKTGKDLTQDQKAKAESIAKNMSEAVRVDAMTIALEKDFERQLAEIKAERDSYKEQADQVELDLAEAKKEIANLKEKPTRTPNVKKLIAELEAKSNETDAIIARAFAPSDIQRMAASESPKLNPNVKNALVDWATRELYKDLDKGVTVGEFYNKISKKANGALSNEDVFDIHAQAANRLIEPHTTTLKRLTERARTDTPPTAEEWQKAFDANAKSLNRKEHLKIAKKIIKSNTDEFAKKLSKVPDKMTSAIIRDGVEQGFSDEAIFHALARRSMSQRDAEVLLQKEYPDVNPRRVMVEANNLIAKAKQTVRDNRIQAENDYKLAEDDLKAIQEERRVNDAVKRRIKKDADNFYSSLSKSNLQTGVEGAISFRKANLLTGIKTHAVNMVSNTTFAGAEEILTRQLATLADIGASKITGQRTVQGLSPTGIIEGFKALVKSDATLKNANEPTGIEKAWSILRHGDSMEEQHKLQYLESHIREKFAPGTAGYYAGSVADAYINFVFRTLSAEDALFKVYAFRRSIEEQAQTRAQSEAGKSLGYNKERYKELIANPTVEMQVEAAQFADDMTYQNNNPISSAVARAKNIHWAAKAAVEIPLPFDRTPTNIVLRLLEYTPLGYGKAIADIGIGKTKPHKLVQNYNVKYRPAVEADLKSGMEGFNELPVGERRRIIDKALEKGFTRQQQQRFARAFGRATTGSAVMIPLGWLLAASGLLTGVMSGDDSEDRNEKGQFFGRLRQGIENKSLLIPNVGRMQLGDDPWSKALVLGATMYEQSELAAKQKKDALGAVMDGTSESLSDAMFEQPLLREVKETVNNRSVAGDVAGGFLRSLVPASGFLGAVSDIGDSKDRRVGTYSPSQRKGKTTGDIQWEGFRNAFTGRLPVLRNYFATESNFRDPALRGGVLRRLMRSVDWMNWRPPVEYKMFNLPKEEKTPEQRREQRVERREQRVEQRRQKLEARQLK